MREVFRHLDLQGNREEVAAVIAEVEASLTGGWTRDSVTEVGMRSGDGAGSVTDGFSCTREAGRPAVTVLLAEKEPGLFSISNVVPLKGLASRRLSGPGRRQDLRVKRSPSLW